MDRASSNEELVDLLTDKLGGRRKVGDSLARVLDAMREVDRALFLPRRERDRAYVDAPLPIGWEQSCSQPSLVALLLEGLDLRPGRRLLEVGSGSGYVAALAARLVGPEGRVLACELVPELLDRSRTACAGLSLFGWPLSSTISFIEGDGSLGFPELGPFDAILLSAGVELSRFDEGPLVDQLAEGGRLLYPELRGRLHLVRRLGGGLHRESWGGVAFVPLRGRNS